MPPKKTPEELHALSRSKRSFKEVNWVRTSPHLPLSRPAHRWQVLDDIFADRSFRFTAPVDQNSPPSEPIYLNFDQLYLEAILSSMKTTANTRQKLISTPEFAINYCKLCLLVNVGRINTTLACTSTAPHRGCFPSPLTRSHFRFPLVYPNMKTALRTYHPVPSLQTEPISQKDMSDAPRIKGMLKMAFLDWEVNNAPTSLKAVAEKAVCRCRPAINDDLRTEGALVLMQVSPELTRGPPTTVIEAIFLVFQEANWVSEKYFPEGFDIWDIFFPSDMPSQPRARAFLTLMHHILESKSFLSDFTSPSTGPIPLDPPISLSRTPAATKENVDPENELQFAREMKEVREGVVKTVPAIQKKEEEAREKLMKKAEKEDAVQGAVGGEPAKKRQKTEGKKKLSYAKYAHQQQAQGIIPVTWLNIKRDLTQNLDPDYDSDEEEAWSYDTLLRRATLTMLNPSTGTRQPPSAFKEYDEWVRRRENGDFFGSVKDDDDEGTEAGPGSDAGEGDE
ncbi:SPOSA6832_02160, partial [Sporobolomyces salmonicolor]